MDWRLPTKLAGLTVGSVGAVAATVFVIVSTSRTDLRSSSPGPDTPSLFLAERPLLVPHDLATTPARLAAAPSTRRAPAIEATGAVPAPSQTFRPSLAPANRGPLVRRQEAEPSVLPPRRPDGPPPRLTYVSRPEAPAGRPFASSAPSSPAAAAVPAAPSAPKPRPLVERPPEGVLTAAEIGRMRSALRLTPEQRPHWPPVEAALREIGAQQLAMVASGRNPREALTSSAAMQLYWAARPLLGVLREDQKAEIRRRARAMGFETVAASI
jgi:hypothetical protein